MLGEFVASHKLVWVHTIKTGNIAGIYRWPYSILDIDDLPSRLYRSSSKVGQLPRRILDFRMSLIWRRRERNLLDRYSLLSVCSEADRYYLGAGPRVQVIPNGFQPENRVPPRRRSPEPRLGFIGTFNWMPNQDGVRWFIREIWPKVKVAVPAVQLRLVGSGSGDEVPRGDAHVSGLGYLQDAGPEIASWNAMIVPIRIGGGTRIKIAEAFSRNCPVVSTSIGALGYKIQNGKEALLADSADDFARACIRILKDPGTADNLAESAAQRFQSEWSWEAQRKHVEAAVRSCIELTPKS